MKKAYPPKAASVDDYFKTVSSEIKPALQKLRDIIKQVAPNAEEVISYHMPAFRLHGSMLVYYAACKTHIGFYPTGSPMDVFKKELEGYKTSKGAIQLTLDKPVPVTLIKNIVKFRIAENKEREKLKKAKAK